MWKHFMGIRINIEKAENFQFLEILDLQTSRNSEFLEIA